MAIHETFAQKYIRYLRVWIGFIAIMAFGNTVQCFVNPMLLKSKLYTSNPQNVNGLVANLFGVWTLLSGGVRLYCAVDIYNKALYNLTYFSFFLALGHFVTEVVIFKTATLNIGIAAPLLVSSLSIVTMSIGYLYLEKNTHYEKNTGKENSILAEKLHSGKYKTKRRD